MSAMARRKLTTRGRVVAAGVCVGITGLLAGLMAATDNTGNATAGTVSGSSTTPGFDSGARTGGNYGVDGSDNRGFDGTAGNGFGSSSSGQPTFPQPNTRSGGS